MSVSIACLIYKNIKYLEFVKNMVETYTPNSKYCEFFFVANDPTDEVVKYLQDNEIPHYIYRNKDHKEYYINRVYRAWNFAVEKAKGDIVVLVNSDMAFSEGWLEGLINHVKPDNVISSRLVESGKMPSGRHGISKDFGKGPDEFKNEEFQKYAQEISIKSRLEPGGLYSPICCYRKTFLENGGYPHGNIMINGIIVPGDMLFWAIMRTKGILHYTSFESIVYHIQTGEQDE